MRRLILLVALVAVAVKAFGNVDIPSPRVESIAPDRVLQSCEGASSKGCTKFVDARMLCECREEAGGWKLRASVRAVPQIYITSTSWLGERTVSPEFGLTWGHFVRPGLIILIVWALSLDAITESARAHLRHRPSLGLAPA